MSEKAKHKLRGILIVTAFPVVMGIAMELICLLATGSHIIISKMDLSSFIKNVFILSCAGIALSLGMRARRMDVSLGAQRLIACLIGCNIALDLGLSGIGVLLFAIFFGCLAGLVSGIIFVTFRVPSMVCALGVALIFESITFVFTDGEGVQFFGNASLEILSSTAFTIIICMTAILIVTVFYTYTPFGYHYQAIRSSQKIAFDSGIKVFRNVLICYVMGGALMAISGVLDTIYKGSMGVSAGMSSVAVSFSGMVSVLIAMYYSRYISIPIAILLATIGMQFMSSCMTALNINSSGASVIQMLFVFAFTFVTNLLNQKKQKEMKRKRIQEADRKWKEGQVA